MVKKVYKCDKKACGEICPSMGLCEMTTKIEHRANDLVYAMEGLDFVGYTEEEFERRENIVKSMPEMTAEEIVEMINEKLDDLVEFNIFVSHENYSEIYEAMKHDPRVKIIATDYVDPGKAIVMDKNALEI